jgi:hypothetical protein
MNCLYSLFGSRFLDSHQWYFISFNIHHSPEDITLELVLYPGNIHDMRRDIDRLSMRIMFFMKLKRRLQFIIKSNEVGLSFWRLRFVGKIIFTFDLFSDNRGLDS